MHFSDAIGPFTTTLLFLEGIFPGESIDAMESVDYKVSYSVHVCVLVNLIF